MPRPMRDLSLLHQKPEVVLGPWMPLTFSGQRANETHAQLRRSFPLGLRLSRIVLVRWPVFSQASIPLITGGFSTLFRLLFHHFWVSASAAALRPACVVTLLPGAFFAFLADATDHCGRGADRSQLENLNCAGAGHWTLGRLRLYSINN